MKPRLFLGVDGGQSSTTALIGDDDGNVVGWGTAGPCNHVSAGEARQKFLRVMGECISQASARANLADPAPHFAAACLGMSGGPDDKASLIRELIRADRLNVTHDARIALVGAMAGAPGTIVIAGTGSIAFGENAANETARAGGWGHIFGDEGGAFDLVRQALRAALREHEGWGPRTAITPVLLQASGAADANAAMHLFYTDAWPRSRVAALAPLVDQAGEAGDPIAREILNNAAQHLATLAATVRRQLWKEDESSGLAWIGGAFNSNILLERFRLLVSLDGQVTAGPPAHAPAMGALILARRAAGILRA